MFSNLYHYMNIESIIKAFNSDGIITTELVAEIQNNRSFCADLVIFFRHNKHREFVLALLDKLIRVRKESELSGDHIMLTSYLLGLYDQKVIYCITIIASITHEQDEILMYK